MYFDRASTDLIKNISETFPVLLLTGPRQVGKTTLLEHIKEKERSYVTLDDLDERMMAKNDPGLFLQRHKPPVIIDEIQYAPELFSAIKVIVDREKKNGLFWLTGSQKFELMKGVSETLAGRVGILELLGLNRFEIMKDIPNFRPFLPNQEYMNRVLSSKKPTKDIFQVYEEIWKGSFPKIISNTKVSREIFYSSYIQTYIERDVRLYSQIHDLTAFQRFLKVAAARTGQLINYADMARDTDIDQKTIKSWISILETSGLIYLLKPYYNNLTNRVIKTPKLYFLDTGLCSYLTGWTTPNSLEAGNMSGAILETYAISEILKSYYYSGYQPQIYFYRDKDMKEIDLIIEYDQTFHPVEFKKAATLTLNAAKNFHVLEKLGIKVGLGVVFCFKETPFLLSEKILAMPISYI
jgi:predicted AAA+ superfamily ATPase